MLKQFFYKNRVFIIGLLGAIALSLQQVIDPNQPQVDWKVLGLAALMAVGSYLGNEFKGKGLSIIGLLGVAGNAFYQVGATGHFTWPSFISSLLIGIIAVITPTPTTKPKIPAEDVEGPKNT